MVMKKIDKYINEKINVPLNITKEKTDKENVI